VRVRFANVSVYAVVALRLVSGFDETTSIKCSRGATQGRGNALHGTGRQFVWCVGSTLIVGHTS